MTKLLTITMLFAAGSMQSAVSPLCLLAGAAKTIAAREVKACYFSTTNKSYDELPVLKNQPDDQQSLFKNFEDQIDLVEKLNLSVGEKNRMKVQVLSTWLQNTGFLGRRIEEQIAEKLLKKKEKENE